MNPLRIKKSCGQSGSVEPSKNGRRLDAATAAHERKLAMRLDECEWQAATGGSRAQLAERLSKLSGRRISEATLSKWLGGERAREMPATLDQAWAAVTGSLRIKQVGAEALGGRFVGLLDLAKIGLAEADLRMEAWRQLRDQRRRTLLLEFDQPAADAA